MSDEFLFLTLGNAFKAVIWGIVIIWLAYIFDDPIADLLIALTNAEGR